MTPQTSLSVALSQEELFVILGYLKTDKFPGLELDVFKKLNIAQLSLLVGIAERALVARNFLKPDGTGRLKLEQVVLAVVGACAFPETSIILTQNRPDAVEEVYFFHTSQKMVVMHTVPVAAIHQFIAVEERAAIAKTILSVLQMKPVPTYPCSPAQIQSAIFNEATEAAQKKSLEEAATILTQAKLDSKAALELAATLAKPVANTTLVHLRQTGKTEISEGFTILQGKESAWLLAPIEGAKIESLAIQPISFDEVVQKIKSLVTQ